MDLALRVLLFNQSRLVGAAIAILVAALFLFRGDAIAQDDGPPDAVAVFNQGQDLHEKGDLAGAIKLYDQALKIIPEFPEAVYQRGLAELALGNKTEAENSLRKAVELRPDWSLALSSLGSLLVTQKKYDEAERILNKAIELDAQNFPALAAMTELRLKTKASNTVLKELLAKMLEITSKANPPTSVWVARAALQNALGLAKDARFSINKVLSNEPANKFALAQSAEIALSAGDTQRAEAETKQLEKITPNDESVMLLRAKVFLSEGSTKEALEILNNTKLVGSQEATDLRKLIETNSSVSAAELEKQLEADTKNAQLLGRLCKLYRKDDPLKSLDYCRRASEAEPDNINHAVGFGAALVQAKQFDSAVNLLKKLVGQAPDNSTVRANLGTALFQLKRYTEAKTEFEWLTNSQPKSAGAYLFLAISHDRLGEYIDAMANYQQYLKLADPAENKLDVDKVNLRLPELQKLIKKK
jgi:tetratricopeptide (TPR) repeat protein